MLNPGNPYYRQVVLLLDMLPLVAHENCFALKGGTAINLFLRDMPRLSVDIDLVYLPIQNRVISLAEIGAALERIATVAEKRLQGVRIQRRNIGGQLLKLFVARARVQVKIEVSPVLRGTVHEPLLRGVVPAVASQFGEVEIKMLAFEDVYAGKLCAALDRQHPRDLFDVHILLANEGISPALKDVFLVYLLGHNRPMVELLDPVMQDIEAAYRAEFAGMVAQTVSLSALIETRRQLVQTLRGLLTETDKRFLLAVKRGEADWSTFTFPEAVHLPAVQWKLHNLAKMTEQKRREAADKLEAVLFG